ncbi:hypothetical protein PAT3040_06602 [Paenibacillus agaridevorans]|uniref:Uncharacterized protein n=1 Tax=Paenibacillus agaridevorans TaxID=171404 RepID=A0A2R5F077_9BACL|nr:hypothetical protein PAT3040_06602 [Paenibacillus agaridevorans]
MFPFFNDYPITVHLYRQAFAFIDFVLIPKNISDGTALNHVNMPVTHWFRLFEILMSMSREQEYLPLHIVQYVK